MSPRSKEQHEKIREERIEQIRKAFSEVYLEKGLQGTDMGDVAKKAGISRALVYYYYKDKMDLFQGMFLEYFEAARDYVSDSLLTDEEPLIRLERYARFYLETAVTMPRRIFLYRNMLNDMPLVFGEQAQTLYQQFSDIIHSPLQRTVEEGIRCGRLIEADPSLLAQTFWGGVAGAMLELAKRHQPEEEMPALVEQALLIIFTGIKK
ncbi:TetR/AcrR family transcriptional regulator [Paenibacillus kobensis]|uniref:TetR/AcrR family transcriptional regulator n=1 Tax=Paenibacillus kobensis TaxID=59841 RepID=UPI000FDBBEA8|nr:TetR/AcrR family transcriptional regulator [Paenibacillus kobensis]